MPINVGTLDRTLRLFVGLGLFILAYEALTGIWIWLAVSVGAILLITALAGRCPAYSLLGIDTRRDRLRGI